MIGNAIKNYKCKCESCVRARDRRRELKQMMGNQSISSEGKVRIQITISEIETILGKDNF